jgi:hypothetical protein
MGYHGNHEARADLFGFAANQEILELGAGGGQFDRRDYYTEQTAGAKESVTCVLSNRPATPQTATTPKTTTP